MKVRAAWYFALSAGIVLAVAPPHAAAAENNGQGFMAHRGRKVIFMPQRESRQGNGCPGFRLFPTTAVVPEGTPCGGQTGVIERADDRGVLIVAVGEQKLMGQVDKETPEGVLLIKRPEVVVVSPAGDKSRMTLDAVNLVFADELEGVKASIGARKVYSVDGKIVTFDPVKHKNEKTKVGRETPLDAIDFAVAWSENADAPVRVVVQAPSGQMGFIDLNRNRSEKVLSFAPPAAKQAEVRKEQVRTKKTAVWQPPKRPSVRKNGPDKGVLKEEAGVKSPAEPAVQARREPAPAPSEPKVAVVEYAPPATPAELTGDSKLLWELSTLNLVDWAFEINKKRARVHGTVQNISTDAVDGGGVRIDFFDENQNKVASHQVSLPERVEAGAVAEFELNLPPDPSYARCGIEFNDGKGEILVAFTDYRKIAY